jgi:hypothetical protein
MVWPSQRYAASWDRVAESYAQAAEAVRGVLIPAGAALRTAVERGLPLLRNDGFHPNVAGTYLAALVTYRAIAGPLPPAIDRPETAAKIARAPVVLTAGELKVLAGVAQRVE